MGNPARQVNDPKNANDLVKGGYYIIDICDTNMEYVGSASCDEDKADKVWASAEHDAIARRVVEELYGDCERRIWDKEKQEYVTVTMYQAKTLKHYAQSGCELKWLETYYHNQNHKGLTLGKLHEDENLMVAQRKVENRDKVVFGGKYVMHYYPQGIPLEEARQLIANQKEESIRNRVTLAEDMSYTDFENIKSSTKFIETADYELLDLIEALNIMFSHDPYELYQQSNMYRFNCEETIKKESDAEHHAYTAQTVLKVIAYLESCGVKIDAETKFLALAGGVVHDVGELKFGDMNIVLKQEYPELSDISNKVEHEEICKFFGFCQPYSAAQDNPLARAIYKFADHIELLLFCKREFKLGTQNPKIQEIYERSLEIVDQAYNNIKEVLGCQEPSSS